MMKFVKRKDASLSENVKQNLRMVRTILVTNRRIVISESSSQLDHNEIDHSELEIKEIYPDIKTILFNLKNPFKIAGIYSKLIGHQIRVNAPTDTLFETTLFDSNIHGLLTCYLRDETSFYAMNGNAQKIVDVFYKFMFCEHASLMEYNLKNGLISNLGKWFYEEGIERFFKKYYFTSQDFTVIVASFMLYGLSALFVAAVSALSKQNFQIDADQIQMIDVAYIKRYGLK